MNKLTLNVDDLRVASFEPDESDDGGAAGAITGTPCVTRPTLYGTCCTP